MDRAAHAHELLAEAADYLGVPGLAFDDDRTAALAIEGGGLVELILDASGRVLTLSSAVGTPPAGSEAALFPRLLAINAMPAQTAGLVMHLDAATGEVGQSRRILLEDLDLATLLAELDRFIGQREAWAAALAAPGAGETEAGLPPAAGDHILWV